MCHIFGLPLSFHHIFELRNVQVNLRKYVHQILSHTNYIRVKDNVNHLFVHLNLCIALALGLVVFIAGIENATNNEVFDI